MLIPTELWRWIYRIPAVSKQQLWYWWRWAEAERVSLAFCFPYSVILPCHGLTFVCLGVCPSMQSTRLGIEIGPEKRRSGLKLDFRSESSVDAAGKELGNFSLV
jgi:hypothetical protein